VALRAVIAKSATVVPPALCSTRTTMLSAGAVNAVFVVAPT
jgi:hypothetical protein